MYRGLYYKIVKGASKPNLGYCKPDHRTGLEGGVMGSSLPCPQGPRDLPRYPERRSFDRAEPRKQRRKTSKKRLVYATRTNQSNTVKLHEAGATFRSARFLSSLSRS